MVDSENASVLYASNHNVARKGDIVSIWFRTEFKTPQVSSTAFAFRSDVFRYEIDCRRLVMRVVSYSYYANNNLDGEYVSHPGEDNLPWQPGVPGTVGEYMINWSCAASKPAPRPAAAH